jgi:Xaa-Pro aminopeptidase
METMQPALKNGRNVWDSVNMPKEEFEARIERVRTAMAGRGLDLLLVYTTGLTDCGDTAYLTNFVIRLTRGTLVAIPRKGEVVTFFEGSSRGLPSLKQTLTVGDLVAAGDLPKESAAYLKETKANAGTVGLAGLKRMPFQQYRTLTGALEGCTFKDADDMLADFRICKSVRESDQIRRAARIVGKLTMFLKETTFEGASQRAIEAALYRQARFEGAEDFRMLLAKPGREGCSVGPADYVPMADGEKVIFYLGVEFERYWAEAIRTFTFKAGSFVEETSPGIISGFQQLCAAMKPGVAISAFCKKASAVMAGKGHQALAPFGLGGGIGLGLSEKPLLTEETPGELKEGMTFALRMTAESGDNYAMVGNTVLVGKDGGIILNVEPARPAE